MKHLLISTAAALIAAVAAQAQTPASDGTAPNSVPDTTPAGEDRSITSFQPTEFEKHLFQSPTHITEPDGEGVFRALCAGCHMPDRKGAVGAGHYPALIDNDNLAVGDYIVTVITHGQKAMPPFGQMLSDEQILAVAAYLQQDMPKDDVVPATAESVQAARESAGPLPH